MTPDQIDTVVSMWHTARRDSRLLESIAAGFPPTDPEASRHADWVVRAVTRLAPMLDRPTSFAPAAAALALERAPLGLDELAADRDALLSGLAVVLGPLQPEELQAWQLAIELFAEIIADLAFEPFR
jgi:hypothetical protein